MAKETKPGFRVYWQGEHPKPKRQFHPGTFEKRQQARGWCRNHSWYAGLTIVAPDGREEPFARKGTATPDCAHQWSAWRRIDIGQERCCAKCSLVETEDWLEDLTVFNYRNPQQ